MREEHDVSVSIQKKRETEEGKEEETGLGVDRRE